MSSTSDTPAPPSRPVADDGRPRQATAAPTQPFDQHAFGPRSDTELRWLGMAGFWINSRGTTMMLDPLLGGFDMPVLIDFPIQGDQVPQLDAVLITHSDNDHYSVPTCRQIAPVTREFHSTSYVATLMKNEEFPAAGHDIGNQFSVGPMQITVTPADHAWQNDVPGAADRTFQPEDCCGFWIDTPDGTLWAPGDSRLIPDHHLHMPTPDALLFDFSDSEWHFGLDGAITMANAYPETPLLLHHWGCVDAPDFPPFNANPADLPDRIVNPDRIIELAPGQPYTLQRLTQKQ